MVAETIIMENYDDAYFRADDYLINIIRRAVSHTQNIQVVANTGCSILILAASGRYIDKTENLQAFCQLPSAEFRVTTLNEKEIPAVNSSRNLQELLWTAGFHASQGRLMDGCFRDDVVELINWPNLTRLPSTPNTMRLASLLAQHPTSLTLAFRMLRIDKSEAFQFYTAARSAGLVRAVNRPAEEPKLKPHRNQALLGLLLHKIAGI